jgi:site-specific DNA recombinase
MRGIILARVSTDEQMQTGQSIPAQLERARLYSANKSLHIADDDEYQFDESSLLDHRKKFEAVLDKIRKSKQPIALVVETVDRLQRSFKESVELDALRKSGKLELHFIRENLIIHKDSTGSEIQRWDLAVFTAKAYVLSISDNVKRTLERKIRDGQWAGYAYVGYTNERSSDDREGLIVADPLRRHFIVRAYNLYVTGLESLASVRQKLIDEGFRTRKDNEPSKSQIERILKNKFYYGIMTIKGKEYPHKYEPLISRELYDKVQNVFAGKTSRPNKTLTKYDFVFKGLIRCGHPDCGCSVTHERKKKKYNMYSCTNSKQVHEGRKYINEDDFLKQVYGVFADLTLSNEQVEEITEEVKKSQESKNLYHTNALKELRTKYDACQNKVDRLLDLYVDKSITKADYDRKLKQYKEEQYEIGQQIQDHTQADENYYLSATQLLNVARNAEKIFERSEPHEKRQLLNFVFQNFVLKDRELVYEVRSPMKSIISCKQEASRKHKTTSISTDRPMWLPDRDSNPDFLDQNQTSCH